jgi:hypothetical protein
MSAFWAIVHRIQDHIDEHLAMHRLRAGGPTVTLEELEAELAEEAAEARAGERPRASGE